MRNCHYQGRRAIHGLSQSYAEVDDLDDQEVQPHAAPNADPNDDY